MTEYANDLKRKPSVGADACEMPLYEDISLPMILVQGWFSDQHECFELFFEELSHEEQTLLFLERSILESAKGSTGSCG